MILILFFILLLNVVAIALTYYCLSNLENKEKIIFIAVGVAIVYMLTSFAYWISTKNVAIKEVSEIGKNLLTFLFVPINGIITLPILAKSYNKYKIGKLTDNALRNRGIVLIILLLIILIIECSYFKDVQNRVITLIEKNNKRNETTQEQYIGTENKAEANEILNTIYIENENNINSNIINNMTVVNKVD